MKRYAVVSMALALQGCSADNGNSGGMGGSPDAAAGNEAAVGSETGSPGIESGGPDTATNPETGSSGQDGGAPSDAAAGDASQDGEVIEAACPSSWLVAPGVDPSISVPDGGGGVLLHASGIGTQDYTCTESMVDGGTTYGWTFVGPEAVLNDCNGTLVGHHFASDGGPGAPEWLTVDGAYVIGRKVNAGFVPDGGAASIPWLLLQAVTHGGSGTLASAQYIQRLETDGGVAPGAATCGIDAGGTTVKVPYSADYYFFGP
jgi:hypothetical protein